MEQIDELFTGEKVLLYWKSSMNATEELTSDLKVSLTEKREAEHLDNEITSDAGDGTVIHMP